MKEKITLVNTYLGAGRKLLITTELNGLVGQTLTRTKGS